MVPNHNYVADSRGILVERWRLRIFFPADAGNVPKEAPQTGPGEDKMPSSASRSAAASRSKRFPALGAECRNCGLGPRCASLISRQNELLPPTVLAWSKNAPAEARREALIASAKRPTITVPGSGLQAFRLDLREQARPAPTRRRAVASQAHPLRSMNKWDAAKNCQRCFSMLHEKTNRVHGYASTRV